MKKNSQINIKKVSDYFWKTLFFIYIILVLYLTVSVPKINYNTFKGEDKIVHFLIYFIGADLFFTAFYKKSKTLYFFIFLSFFLLIPFITEFLQLLTPYRSYSLLDMAANYVGIFVGYLFFMFKYKAFN
ncbi:VanZ family protein [Petrotoga sp. 9PWA.NaAc.5.4]|uniref:VanZ family protein n=1 Tax=Petrotoga sp. 9PWA.NaAc.5.4 TaxID=1434328 RepID=UPI000CC73CD4|nr:VanZ family protein [Petrotoga sp. 9PWA.NaAc.5.4]PNR94741.1 hypothetical protein X924_05615 [Petrotoga sp. 9PWA.NaAc.5.4]